jgi:hypothetical protein
MNKEDRKILKTATCVNLVRSLIALFCFTTAVAGAAEATQFDGKWNAEAITDTGDCKDKYSFKFKVKEGNVKGRIKGKKGFYKLSGQIVLDGATELGLDGFDAGKFVGVFEGSKAVGTWETKNCNGSFTFKKKS